MLKLIKYRDAGMHTHTWFWINLDEAICSPYFDSEEEAKEWGYTLTDDDIKRLNGNTKDNQ